MPRPADSIVRTANIHKIAETLCSLTWSAAAGAQKETGAHSSTGHCQPLARLSQPPMLLLLRPAFRVVINASPSPAKRSLAGAADNNRVKQSCLTQCQTQTKCNMQSKIKTDET